MTSYMSIITETAELAEFCGRAAAFPYITVDTEFIQGKDLLAPALSYPSGHPRRSVGHRRIGGRHRSRTTFRTAGRSIGPQGFHAARQDVEIFVNLCGKVPTPLFDTQIAAMVCGYGDSVGYERLVRDIAKKSIDKTMRFTDWSKRPLEKNRSITHSAT